MSKMAQKGTKKNTSGVLDCGSFFLHFFFTPVEYIFVHWWEFLVRSIVLSRTFKLNQLTHQPLRAPERPQDVTFNKNRLIRYGTTKEKQKMKRKNNARKNKITQGKSRILE